MKDITIERMYFAKTLFLRGENLVSSPKDLFEFSSGILLFQDAVEISLGAIATKLKANFPEKIWFADQFKRINEKLEKLGKPELPFQRELLQLNAARVKIKHFGILQRPEDYREAVESVKSFLNSVSINYFGVEFSSLSLADSVPNKEAKRLIKEAENCLSKRDYRGCVKNLALAKYSLVGIHFIKGLWYRFFDHTKIKDIEWEKFEYGKDEVWLLEHGIDSFGYHRLCAILPEIGWNSVEKKVVLWWEGEKCHEGNWSEENLRWAIDFLVSMGLKLNSVGAFPKLKDTKEYFNFKVTAKVDEAKFWNYWKGEETDARMKRMGKIAKCEIILRLKKGEFINGWADRDKEHPEYWLVFSSGISMGFEGAGIGFVSADEVQVERIPIVA